MLRRAPARRSIYARRCSGGIGFPQASLKSFHSGFFDTIRAIFLIRVQPLICFSLEIAAVGLPQSSKYTSRSHLYFDVKPLYLPFLCFHTRVSNSELTPTYSVFDRLLMM